MIMTQLGCFKPLHESSGEYLFKRGAVALALDPSIRAKLVQSGLEIIVPENSFLA